MPDLLFAPVPNETAIAFLARKAPLRVEAFKKLLPELRAHAFTVSGVMTADALQAMRDAVATIPGGADYKKVKKEIVKVLGQHLPLQPDLFEDEEEAAKAKAALERRAEFVVRNNAFQAYSASAYQELDDMRDVFTHWKYLTVGDGRERDSHRALNGVILPNKHPFWKTHFPPWEFGCRCQVVGLLPFEVDDARRRDAQLPPEKRSVIEGDLLQQLEDDGSLTRDFAGNGALKIDVRSPRERGDADAWHWDPGDLALSFAGLRGRYDADTWAAFTAWARQPGIGGDSGSVWDWLELAVRSQNPPPSTPSADIAGRRSLVNDGDEAAARKKPTTSEREKA